MTHFKGFILFAIANALAVFGSAASAQPKPIRLVVFASGGPSEFVARHMVEKLAPMIGTQVVIEPRPGANGIIAAQNVAASEADGTSLLLTSSGLWTITPVLGKSPYDPDKELTPVSRLVVNASAVIVDGAVPAKDIREFVAYAKSRKELSFGSPGIGNIGHLWLEQFNTLTGLQIIHVPYKGASGIITDMLGGRIAGTIIDLPAVLTHVRSGRMKAMGLVGTQRSPLLPELPTIAEQGFPGIESLSWYGVFAPIKTPQETVARLSQAIGKAMLDPDVVGKLRPTGAEPAPLTPEEFARQIRNDRARWAKLIQEKHITAE